MESIKEVGLIEPVWRLSTFYVRSEIAGLLEFGMSMRGRRKNLTQSILHADRHPAGRRQVLRFLRMSQV